LKVKKNIEVLYRDNAFEISKNDEKSYKNNRRKQNTEFSQ
jgi:hypothetical protein